MLQCAIDSLTLNFNIIARKKRINTTKLIFKIKTSTLRCRFAKLTTKNFIVKNKSMK